MGEAASAPADTKRSAEPPMSHMLSWMATAAKQVGSACVQRLSAPGATPVLFASVCLAIVYCNRKKRSQEPRSPAPVLHRSMSMAALHGGRVTMQRIIDSAEARVDQTVLEDAAKKLQGLLDEQIVSFSQLQREAAKLEMSGKEDEAVEMLRKAWNKATKGGQPHEAHEFQMLLVEMLIYMGEYEEALRCKCLEDKEILDARGPLYKAVIYNILGKSNEAQACYKDFQNIRRFFSLTDTFKADSMIYGAVHDFDEFKKVVNNLKKEIDHAHKANRA